MISLDISDIPIADQNAQVIKTTEDVRATSLDGKVTTEKKISSKTLAPAAQKFLFVEGKINKNWFFFQEFTLVLKDILNLELK